jgi:hypothetical protein
VSPVRGAASTIMRAMDDVELTEDEINDLLRGDDQGAGWDEEDGYEWVS